MKHLLLILLVMLLTMPMVSCNDTSGPEPTPDNQNDPIDEPEETRRQIVKFTLVKAVEYGDCDSWACEAWSDAGSEFRGDVYVQVEGLTKYKLWDVSWNNARDSKTLNKSIEYNIPKDTKITIWSEGLIDHDDVSGNEGISEFKKEFYYPIKNYNDLTFDCLHGTYGSGCYCCITFHWKIEAEFIDPVD